MRFPGSLSFWVGLAVSSVFVYLAVVNVDWEDAIITLRSANLLLVVGGTALAVSALVVVAGRWNVLLAASAHLRVIDTFSYLMIGYLANSILPMRLGDLIRATLVNRKHGIKIGVVLGSVVLGHVLDVLTAVSLVVTLSWVVDLPPLVRAGVTVGATGVLAALAVLFVLAANERGLQSLMDRLARFAPPPLWRRLTTVVVGLARGMHALRSPRQLAQVLILTAIVWSVSGLATVFWVRAFDLPVPWYSGFFVVAVVNLGGVIPSSPGAIGVYHFLAILAMSAWDVDREAALGYALGTHGVIMLVNIIVGSVFLAKQGIPMRSLRTLQDQALVAESGQPVR